jgi:hypothetical protein
MSARVESLPLLEFNQGGVEEAADCIACLGRHGLGGVAQERGQRHDHENREQKKQRVCFGPGLALLSVQAVGARPK